MSPFRRTASLLALLVCTILSAALAQSRTQECFGDGSIEGYKTIEDMNLDMEDIVTNGTLDGGYTFRFCPITRFDVVEPLRPILNDTLFVCGAGGEEEGCILSGGTEQVTLEGDLFNVTFLGMVFQNFTNTSVSASASGNSTVLFDRCRWSVRIHESRVLLALLCDCHKDLLVFLTRTL